MADAAPMLNALTNRYRLCAGLGAVCISVASVTLVGGLVCAVLAAVLLAGRFALPASVLLSLSRRHRELEPLPMEHSTSKLFENLCEISGMVRPKLFISDRPGVEAEAVEARGAGAIIVGRGLTMRPPAEQRVVLAHELAHLYRQHTRLVTAVRFAMFSSIALTCAVQAGVAGERLMEHSGIGPGVLVAICALTMIGTALLHEKVCSRVEWQADDLSVALTHDRHSLVAALRARLLDLKRQEARRLVRQRIARLA